MKPAKKSSLSHLPLQFCQPASQASQVSLSHMSQPAVATVLLVSADTELIIASHHCPMMVSTATWESLSELAVAAIDVVRFLGMSGPRAKTSVNIGLTMPKLAKYRSAFPNHLCNLQSCLKRSRILRINLQVALYHFQTNYATKGQDHHLPIEATLLLPHVEKHLLEKSWNRKVIHDFLP